MVCSSGVRRWLRDSLAVVFLVLFIVFTRCPHAVMCGGLRFQELLQSPSMERSSNSQTATGSALTRRTGSQRSSTIMEWETMHSECRNRGATGRKRRALETHTHTHTHTSTGAGGLQRHNGCFGCPRRSYRRECAWGAVCSATHARCRGRATAHWACAGRPGRASHWKLQACRGFQRPIWQGHSFIAGSDQRSL